MVDAKNDHKAPIPCLTARYFNTTFRSLATGRTKKVSIEKKDRIIKEPILGHQSPVMEYDCKNQDLILTKVKR
jgi:hypothetical protein